MSFHLTLFGPRHYFWKGTPSAWFYRPDDHSTGGVGFKVPFLHICLMWGRKR